MNSAIVGLPKHQTISQKWRKPASKMIAIIGASLALFTLPAGMGAGWHEACEIAGFALLGLAALGRIWSLAYIAGRKNLKLCQSGPYSLTRNPLYLFSFIGTVGFTLAVQNVLLAGFAATCFLAYYAWVIRGEESRLLQLHGEEFVAYCQKVPRFWPRMAKPASEATLELNVAPFLRGVREASCFLLTIIAADAIEWAHLQALWPTYPLPF